MIEMKWHTNVLTITIPTSVELKKKPVVPKKVTMSTRLNTLEAGTDDRT